MYKVTHHSYQLLSVKLMSSVSYTSTLLTNAINAIVKYLSIILPNPEKSQSTLINKFNVTYITEGSDKDFASKHYTHFTRFFGIHQLHTTVSSSCVIIDTRIMFWCTTNIKSMVFCPFTRGLKMIIFIVNKNTQYVIIYHTTCLL